MTTDAALLIHAIDENQRHPLAACGEDTTPMGVLSDWDAAKVTCVECRLNASTPVASADS